MAQNHTAFIASLPEAIGISRAALGGYIHLINAYELSKPLSGAEIEKFASHADMAELFHSELLTRNDDGTYTLKPIPGLG